LEWVDSNGQWHFEEYEVKRKDHSPFFMPTQFIEEIPARVAEEFGTADYQDWQRELADGLRDAGRVEEAELVEIELKFVESQMNGYQLWELARGNPTRRNIEGYAAWLDDQGHAQHAAVVRARTPEEFAYMAMTLDFPPFHASQEQQLLEAIAGFLKEHHDIQMAFLRGVVLDRDRQAEYVKKKMATVLSIIAASFSAIGLLLAANSYMLDRQESAGPAVLLSGLSAIVTAIGIAAASLFHRNAQSLAGEQQEYWNQCPVRCIDPNR
jgi:hypothetical protein